MVSAVASGNVGRQLGAVARRVRESQDLTLTDVASSAGISAGMLSRLETGHVTPSLETLVALAGALGPVDRVMYGIGWLVLYRSLRQKLGDEHHTIETVLGAGYKWVGGPR